MKRVSQLVMVLAFVGAAALPSIGQAQPQEPAVGVQRALEDLSRWLGPGENAARWHAYLLTDALQAQLQNPQQPDNEVLGRVLSRYMSQAPGVEGPRFQRVRHALEAWHAEESSRPENLANLVESAADNYQPIPPQRIELARAEMLKSLAELRAYLRRSGPENAAAWEEYLEWPALVEQTEADVPDVNAIEAVLDNFERNETGLESPRFLRAREALRDYAYLAAAAGADDPEAAYRQQIERLAAGLEAYAKEGHSVDAADIGNVLGYLERTGQTSPLIQAIRMNYLHPNFYGYASERFAAIGFEEPVDQVTPVRDNILGTSIFGTAHMRGMTTMRLVPNPTQAQFNLMLFGTAVSNNVGYNRGVTIYSTGVTQIQANKPLWMNEGGLTHGPATACCKTCTTINDICAKHRLVERIAWKRTMRSKAEAEAIASRKAEVRVARNMDERSAPRLADANERYVDRFKTPLVRRNAYPEDLNFSTTDDRVIFTGLSAPNGLLGAPEPPPAIQRFFDLSTQVHESGVINFGQALLGGLTLTDEELVRLIRDELKQEVPEELEITPDKDPWSITFAREIPVRAVFNDQTVLIAIRGRRFTRSDQRINEPIEISALYTVERGPTGARLVRQGDVEVTYLDRERLGAAQVAFKTFLRRKFEAMFKEEFVGEGLKLKGRYAKVGTMRLENIDASNAWISLGWNIPPQGAAPAPAGRPLEAVPAPPPAQGG